MKIFGMRFGRRPAAPALKKPVAASNRSRVDAALAPNGETPGSSMSYRGIFEMVAGEALKELRLNRGQADIEVVRVRTVDDAPKYQVIVVAHVRALISPKVMVEFSRCFTHHLSVVSRPARMVLLGVSWAMSKKLAAENDFQATDVLQRSPFPGQEPRATDFGSL